MKTAHFVVSRLSASRLIQEWAPRLRTQAGEPLDVVLELHTQGPFARYRLTCPGQLERLRTFIQQGRYSAVSLQSGYGRLRLDISSARC